MSGICRLVFDWYQTLNVLFGVALGFGLTWLLNRGTLKLIARWFNVLRGGQRPSGLPKTDEHGGPAPGFIMPAQTADTHRSSDEAHIVVEGTVEKAEPDTKSEANERAPKAATARLALGDCAHALDALRVPPTGIDWRVYWVAAVTLLRAVGHVLEKVDATDDPRLGQATAHWWDGLNATKPDPGVFWHFIDEERNNVVKELKFGASQNVTVRLGSVEVNLKTGEQRSTPGLPPLYDHVMRDGPFAGQDPREVVQSAVDWWAEQLDHIEAEAARIGAA